MAETKNIAVLFDFDGVVVDTETQYSVFWHKMGVDYLGMEDLESRVKGQTLMYIYDTFFPGMTKKREEITVGLDRFEQDMSYDFIPGVEEFIADLHRNGVKMAATKPALDCFLLSMEVFDTTPETTYVFEDSFNGLKAGMASGATVIGLATTNSREEITPLCHYVLDDFQGFTYDKLTELHK